MNKSRIIYDKVFWLLFIFAAIYILGNIGTGSLTTWDEAVYANISKEILKTNSWFILYEHGNAWIDKPPMYMCLSALFYKLLGVNELAARLPSGLMGLATVMLLYIFIKEIVDRNAAVLSALLLLAMPHYLHFAKMGMLDVSLTFFIVLMIYFFWKGEENPVFLFWSGIAFGAAYFTKGFASFLGLFIIGLYALFAQKLRLLFRRQFILGILISLALIAGWHYAEYKAFGRIALDKWFGYHVYARATGALDGHVGGPNFYQKAIFNKNKPWAVIPYLALLYMVWLSVRKHDKRAILACSWILATYVLFSAVATKIHNYIIPIYPALALSSGIFLARFLKNKMFHIFLSAVLILMVVQVSYSWAFKLDFSLDLKTVAARAEALKARGAYVFSSPRDASDVFYTDFAVFLTPDTYAAAINNNIRDAFLLVPSDQIGPLASEYNFAFTKVYDSWKLSMFKIRLNK